MTSFSTVETAPETSPLARRIRFILPREHRQEPIRRTVGLIHETLRRRRAHLDQQRAIDLARLSRRMEECARLYLDLAGDIVRFRIEERSRQLAPKDDPVRFVVVAQWAAGLIASDFPDLVTAATDILFGVNTKVTPEELEERWKDSVWCVQEMLQRAAGFLTAEQKKAIEAVADLKGEHVQVAVLGYLPEEDDWEPAASIDEIVASRDKAFCEYVDVSEAHEAKHKELCLLADEIACQKEARALWDEFSSLEKQSASFPFWLHACLWVDIAKEMGVMSVAQEGRMMAQVAIYMPATVEFWQIIFADFLGELTPESRDLLRWCVEHPRKINRHKTPPGLINRRRELRVWDWVWTPQSAADKSDLVRAITQGSDDDVRLFFAEFLSRSIRNLKLADTEHRTLIKKIGEMLGNELLQYTEGLAESYSFEYGNRKIRSALEIAEDREWDALVAEEVALQEKQAEEVARSSRISVAAKAPAPAAPEGTAVARQFHFSYVENWGAKDLRTIDFSTTEDGLAERLEKLLPEQGVPLTMPAASIARAILHYLSDTPPEIKAVMNKEYVGNVSWHKLRRDRIRIFIREIEGRTYFHVMLRRDWKKSDLVERRY